MGLVASSCVEAGGSAFGVIPKAFVSVGERGDAHTEHVPGTEVTVVGGMHERKTLMSQMSTGGFITLPGGFGSFEEVRLGHWSSTWRRALVCLPSLGSELARSFLLHYLNSSLRWLHGLSLEFTPQKNQSLCST